MEERQGEKYDSKIEHVFRDEESIKLLSKAFRGSAFERVAIAAFAALAIFGGFAVAAWAWHGDVSDKRLESEITQKNNFIQHMEVEIKNQSNVLKSFYVQATHIRNLIDKKLLICNQIPDLSNLQKLDLVAEQFAARETYVSALIDAQNTFPKIAEKVKKNGQEFERIYEENIDLPCSLMKSSTSLGFLAKQNEVTFLIDNEIMKNKKKLEALIQNRAKILFSEVFSDE